MARIRVTNTTEVTHNAVQIEGLREISFSVDVIEKEFASDGDATEVDPVDFRVTGEAVFDDVQAYNTALGNAEANLVVTGRVEGGSATRTLTAKNCKFTGTRISVPTRQSRDVGVYRCPLRCVPGPSDDPEDMIAEAAGA